MSSLKEFRTGLGLSLEQTAVALDLKPTSASWLSEIENGKRDASLRLALRIERWSAGVVPAGSVCKELAAHDAAPVVDGGVVAPPDGRGAGKNEAVFSSAGEAA